MRRMSSTKRRSRRPPKVSPGALLRQMSVVISLREKVAQAELDARIYGADRAVLQAAKSPNEEAGD
jgi:hypothetical protein